MIPKFNLIYFKHILENSVSKFIQNNNESFSRIDGRYVYSKQISRNRLKIELKKNVLEEIHKYTKDFNILNPEYYLIIGSCYPKSNILLRYIPKGTYIPMKLNRIITEYPDIKYVLKESDILIDIESINCIFEEIFNDFFKDKTSKNVIFIKHKDLDCYSMFKTLKKIYGNINVVNLYEKHSDKMSKSLYSINEWILKYVRKRNIMNNDEMKMTVESVHQYLKERIGF